METDASPRHRRDALLAAVACALLAGLWIVLGLYWQGVLLLGAAAGLGLLHRRLAERTGEAELPATAPKEKAPSPSGPPKGKDRKRRR